VEFAITFALIIMPVTFAIIFTAEMLWVWHSMVDYTRDGARYATTHCWEGSGENVITYMRSHVPVNIDQDQFRNGQADIVVSYFARDAASGTLTDFSCDGDCSTTCIPDAVTVSIRNYSFTRFMSYLALPPVALPDFRTSLPMEGAGCDPDQAVCTP